jgi:Tfp pilus assembly protein PilX
MIYNNHIKKASSLIDYKDLPRGVVLITSLIITLLLAVIATTILALGLWSYQQATFYEDYNQALYSAEAGINYAISANTAGWGTVSSSSTGSLFNASFYVRSSTLAADTIQIISTATVNRLTYRVRAVSVNVIDQDP